MTGAFSLPGGAETVYGRVTDTMGRPVEGAVAVLFSAQDEGAMALVSRFITGADGRFLFRRLRRGAPYLIEVFRGDGGANERENRP